MLNQVCRKIAFLLVVHDVYDPWHVMCFGLLTVNSIHSFKKVQETARNSKHDARWQKFIGQIREKSSWYIKRPEGKKSAQKKELLDTPCGSNIKTVVEEHIISSENIYSIQWYKVPI